MEIKAAVARQAHQPFSIERASIEAPRSDEVLVEIHGVGLCHTDLIARDQFIPIRLPAVLGHEGAGIVIAVGKDVKQVRAGDRVVLSFASCGECARCEENLPSYCRHFPALNYAGVRSDGSSKPARVHMRDPSFVNLQAVAPMARDSYIADLIATLAMLDPILGGIDR